MRLGAVKTSTLVTKMPRVFQSGEEVRVFVDEEFDIRLDGAPQETSALLDAGGLLVPIGSTGVRREGDVMFFHFKAVAPGVQRIRFPPTMLAQNIEIQNSIGVPIVELRAETAATEPISEVNPPTLADTA